MHRLSLILWKTQDIQYTERGWDGILSLSTKSFKSLAITI